MRYLLFVERCREIDATSVIITYRHSIKTARANAFRIFTLWLNSGFIALTDDGCFGLGHCCMVIDIMAYDVTETIAPTFNPI